jgi:class 3 adenylate cyclase
LNPGGPADRRLRRPRCGIEKEWPRSESQPTLRNVLACPNCGRENPDEASFCLACATPLMPATPPREVRKTVTALFCDLVGSTALAERYDPEVLKPLLRSYFEEMRAIIERHGGFVEKFIGDAVVAVFGIPQVHEDDALRAVRAAVEMRERLRRVGADLPVELGCRIGSRRARCSSDGRTSRRSATR